MRKLGETQASSQQLLRLSETRLSDGTLQFERIRTNMAPDLVWLCMIKDQTSWGQVNNVQRTFEDFINLMRSSALDPSRISLSLLTGSEQEYRHFRALTKRYHFARFTVLLHPGFHEMEAASSGSTVEGRSKHHRSETAKLRNYLLLRTLRDERHIFWLDPDVYEVTPGIIPRMISHSESHEDAGIITARCSLAGDSEHDLHSWSGTKQDQHYLAETLQGTSDADLVPLTAVGASILYMRASLVWQGLTFPAYYTVGSGWDHEGHDGIETEGLCHQSRGLKGGGCFALGGNWHVSHTS